jgi:hypothetical protein
VVSGNRKGSVLKTMPTKGSALLIDPDGQRRISGRASIRPSPAYGVLGGEYARPRLRKKSYGHKPAGQAWAPLAFPPVTGKQADPHLGTDDPRADFTRWVVLVFVSAQRGLGAASFTLPVSPARPRFPTPPVSIR